MATIERRKAPRTNSTLRRILDITFNQIRKDEEKIKQQGGESPWKKAA